MVRSRRNDLLISGAAVGATAILAYALYKWKYSSSTPAAAPVDAAKPSDELKDQGDKAFKEKRYEEAVELYSQAIKLDPANWVLYSNRSVALGLLAR
jgi:Flp pilus assembly protein TadD